MVRDVWYLWRIFSRQGFFGSAEPSFVFSGAFWCPFRSWLSLRSSARAEHSRSVLFQESLQSVQISSLDTLRECRSSSQLDRCFHASVLFTEPATGVATHGSAFRLNCSRLKIRREEKLLVKRFSGRVVPDMLEGVLGHIGDDSRKVILPRYLLHIQRTGGSNFRLEKMWCNDSEPV